MTEMLNWFYASRGAWNGALGDRRSPAEITRDIRAAAWDELRRARQAKAEGRCADVYVAGARGYMRRYVQRVQDGLA